MPQKIIIVGGGISGLAAAWYLQQKGGADVTILESDPRCGGKINTIHEDGFTVECGPDSFLTTKPRAMQLMHELGLENELIAPINNEYYIVRNGKLVKPPKGLNMLVPVDAEAFRASDFFSYSAKEQILAEKNVPVSRVGEDESLAAFVTRRFGKEMLENYAEPLFGGIYGTTANEMSIMATLPVLKEYEKQFGSVTAGVLHVRKENTGEKVLPMFMSLRNGTLSMIETLIDKLTSCKMYTDTKVTGIEKKGNSYLVQTSAATMEADRILFTTPAHITAKLLSKLTPHVSNELKNVSFTSTAILTLALPDKSLGEYENSTGFVIPRNERINITASTFSSSKWPCRAPEGYTLVRCFFGSTNDQRFLKSSVNELEQQAMNDLQHFCGVIAKPVKRWYQLWENALPQYHVGHPEFLKNLKTLVSQHKGIYLSGASYNGVGLPDCVRQAWEVVEEMAADQSSV